MIRPFVGVQCTVTLIFLATRPTRMLDAEFEVCTECGTLHMEGGPGPRDVEECAVCGGRLSDVELDDLIGL
jgi:hypothetical protein